MNTTEDNIFFTIDGKEYCDEERCLAQLLLDGVLFCNERETVWYPLSQDPETKKITADKTKIEVQEPTTVLYVLCNDLFYWGTADGESLTNDEIGPLYKMHMADKKWGSSKWCCFKRKLRPQVPIVEDMKKDGVWDAAMEALPAPHPS